MTQKCFNGSHDRSPSPLDWTRRRGELSALAWPSREPFQNSGDHAVAATSLERVQLPEGLTSGPFQRAPQRLPGPEEPLLDDVLGQPERLRRLFRGQLLDFPKHEDRSIERRGSLR